MRCEAVRGPFPLALLLVARPLLGQAGAPAGPEFRVNSETKDNQQRARVAADSLGNFVVVWQSYLEDGSQFGVFGQRFASTGAPAGPEFRVNSYTSSHQAGPSVAENPSGGFVVAWYGDAITGDGLDVFAQRYSSSGAPLGGELRVNSFTTDTQRSPSVVSDSSGNFVVVWEAASQDGSYTGVFGQRYASSGAPLGSEFRVNTYTTAAQRYPGVASDPSGRFVVVWQSNTQDGYGYGVFGQRYASTGAPSGAEFRINIVTSGLQTRAGVAADSAGNFVVVWYSDGQDGSGYSVFARRYASSGAPLGAEFRVNTYTSSGQYTPSVASDSSGGFVVVWHSVGQDGSSYGVFGQRYASSGATLGGEFRVNTYTTDYQYAPSVASVAAGRFVVVWSSKGQDAWYFGVYAQRYGVDQMPAVTLHPMNQTVCAGATATFTSAASGLPEPGVKWQVSVNSGANWNDLPGETATTLTFAASSMQNNNQYRAVFTNSGGSATSNPASLTVITDTTSPAVTAPPAQTATQTLCQ